MIRAALCLFALVASNPSATLMAQSEGAYPEKAASAAILEVAGKGKFVFTNWDGSDLPVWTYVPPHIDRKTAPIAIIMHGARRDPDRYRDEWTAQADRHGFIVVAPGFSRDDFPRANGYNLGFMRDTGTGEWRPKATWTFSAIEPIFEAVVSRLGGTQTQYTLYGHSAGSQFVHRMLFFAPGARVKRYLPANAGWYTFPDTDVAFPFGVGATMLDEDDLRRALAKDVVILLGDRDNDPQGRSLNRSAGALAQGPHRFARGQAFFAAARDLAADKGWDFGWTVRIVPGVAHSNGDMAKQVADLIE